MQDATLNIRLEPALKQHGAEVLKKEGVTVTQAVRALYEYMEEHQALPAELFTSTASSAGKRERRRELMRSMVGILPVDITLDEAREARLSSHGL